MAGTAPGGIDCTMSILALGALAALVLTVYGFMIVWFVASRHPGVRTDQTIRAIAALGRQRLHMETDRIRTIDIRRKQPTSVSQTIWNRLGVIPYESLYYPMRKELLVVAAVVFDASCALFIRVVFQIPWPLLYLAMPLAIIFTCRWMFNLLHNRRRGKLFLQLPDALDQIVRAIRIGVATTEALKTVARDAPEPTATEFRKLSDTIAVGIPIAEAMRNMATNNQLSEYRFVAIAVSLQTNAGGSIGGTLENVAQVIRSRVGIKIRGRALTGEARASAGVLTGLPVVTTLMMSFVSPHYLLQLFVTKSGLHYFGAAVIMLGMGQFIMRSMVRRTLDQVQ